MILSRRCFAFAAGLWLLHVASAAAAELLIEAESFRQLGGWVVDSQFTHVMGSPYSDLQLIPVKPYLIPFRCLYSRNIDNLMMAGRDVSATHVAYSSTKLMKTGGQMGVAVGAAAMLCKKYDTTPRRVYENHIQELKDIVFERGAYQDALKPKE